jgi:hypothetical protein
MNNRTAVTIIVGIGSVGLLICAGVCFLGFRFFTAMRQFPMTVPPALARPGVIQGAGTLDRSVFFTDSAVGSVTDIILKPVSDAQVGIAGTGGAVFLTADGTVQSRVGFSSRTGFVQFVDVEGDGVWEYLNRGGGGWGDASLLDDKGRVVWTYGGMPGLDDIATGDLDGDGVLDFVAGFNGGGGVRRLDKNAALQWTESDGNVWHVEIVDTDGDGTPEIVHSNAGGQITIRDPSGRVVRRARPGAYFSHFSLCRWPGRTDSQYLLLAEDDKIWVFDYDGKTLASLDAPDAGTLGHAHGTPVRLSNWEAESLAVVVEFQNWGVSVLYVYGPDKKLAYQEIIPDACNSIAPLPRDGTELDDILIGGTGIVWKYSAAAPAAKETPAKE